MAEMPESPSEDDGRKLRESGKGASSEAAMSNKAAAGVDQMSVEQLKPYLQEHWAKIREELLKGEYQPQPVRCVEIPKPQGVMRQLGIPTVVDRLIQQALHNLPEIATPESTPLRHLEFIREQQQEPQLSALSLSQRQRQHRRRKR